VDGRNTQLGRLRRLKPPLLRLLQSFVGWASPAHRRLPGSHLTRWAEAETDLVVPRQQQKLGDLSVEHRRSKQYFSLDQWLYNIKTNHAGYFSLELMG
jgi:hypothetical protein